MQSEIANQLTYADAKLAEIGKAMDAARANRKTIIDNALEQMHPKEAMDFMRGVAEIMQVPLSRVMKMAGDQINRGDTTILNDEGEVIGNLALADIFDVGQHGEWLSIAKDKVVWFMHGVERDKHFVIDGTGTDVATVLE